MSTRIAILALAASVITLGGCGGSTSPEKSQATGGALISDAQGLADFKSAIRAKYDLKEKAFAEENAEAIVTKFYTEDVITAAVGDKVYHGRSEIRPQYEAHVKGNHVKIESIDSFVAGDAGWDWADFHVYPTDGKTPPYTFAILFLWAKINGEWMCKGDYFTVGSFREGKLPTPPATPTTPK